MEAKTKEENSPRGGGEGGGEGGNTDGGGPGIN